MYTRFFGLNEKPFAITPDPRYLFMSERHGEGLAHLVYGVTESGGFIQLTGEVGTGKTTLVRTLLGQLPNEVDVALILNPQLTELEFLLAISEELGVRLPQETGSSKALVDALNRHLLAVHAKGRRTILLVDEAQNLSEGVLEQVRLLTNLETARQKLLQIILIGQPELRDLLAQNNLRQLAQRVTGRYHLEPLSKEEAQHYIEHRLRVAGALSEIFDPAAKRAVFRLSGGIPRIMNVICDRALLGAYSAETRHVDKGIVRRAAKEVAGSQPARPRWLLPLLAGAVLATVAAAGIWQQQQPPSPATGVVSVPLDTAAEPVTEAVHVEEATETSAPPPETVSARPSLEEALVDHPSNVDTAMQTLFDRWGQTFQSGAGTGCAQAEALGLSCLFQRGSWNIVQQMNRPAMLTLTDSAGNNHHPVLTAIDGGLAELAIGNVSLRFPIDEVSGLWFGQYMLLWRPPGGQVAALRPGSRSPRVTWLRESLAGIDADYTAESSDPAFFDAGLERQLMEFQRRNRLQVDGLAGQQTQILINSLLADENTPQLARSGR